MKKLILFLFIFGMINLATAVSLDVGTILNTTNSNTSLTIDLKLNTDLVTITKDNISLTNVICSNSAGSIGNVSLNTINHNTLSSTLCPTETLSAHCNTIGSSLGSFASWIAIIVIVLAVGIIIPIVIYQGTQNGIDSEKLIAAIIGIILTGIVLGIGILVVNSIC